MVNYDTVLIRYGELSTKGKNRKDFIKRLDKNIRRMLKDYPNLSYRRTYDRIYIKLTDENPEEIKDKLQKVLESVPFLLLKKYQAILMQLKKPA